MPFTVAEVAKWIGGLVDGDGTVEISELEKIEKAKPGQLSFLANPKYYKYIETTNASAILVDLDFPKSTKTLVRIKNPYFAFLKIAERLYSGVPGVGSGIHPSVVVGNGTKIGENEAIAPNVVIGNNCKIGKNAKIYPSVVIGDEVEIGDNVILYANVSIRERNKIGDNVIIHMGAVLGSDGFGYAFENGKYFKLPQMGNVIVEDDVEIGANTTIDRATLGETIIRKGTKIDNLVQIAHNVEIGSHTAIAALTGIAGSTTIGQYVRFGGQAGVVGHIKIGDNSTVGAQAGVMKSFPHNSFISGMPAREHMRTKREEASLAKLPALIKKIRRLETELEELKKNDD
jgi:UDP-3-O-[3-hydroxymyristoyl] glucosamine N-acyltransferase